MPTVQFPGRRLVTLALTLALAVVVGGADGCSSDPNVEGARLYIRNGELPDAAASLDRALEANPDNVSALALRAEVRRLQADAATDASARQGFFDQMSADIARAYTLAPTDADVMTTRTNGWATAVTKGNAALTSEAVAPAVAQGLFRTAIAILPDSSQGHFGLGLAHLRADDAPGAITPLREAVRIDPSTVAAHIYLSRALLLAEQNTEAITVLEAAAERFPADPDIQASLLNAYAVSGRTDDALARYATAIAADPGNALLYSNYGTLLLRAGRFDEAVTQLEQAIALAPDDASAQYNLGAALQNKASALTDEANALPVGDTNYDRLIAERNTFLERSLPYFIQARQLSAAAGIADDERDACRALFVVYGGLNRAADAAAVAECAGESMD
jgi:tetratricopeptide (TPR) repeat protein